MAEVEGDASITPWRVLAVVAAACTIATVAFWLLTRPATIADETAVVSTTVTTATAVVTSIDSPGADSGENETPQTLVDDVAEVSLTVAELDAVGAWFEAVNNANSRAGRFGSDVMMARMAEGSVECDEGDVFADRYSNYEESGLLNATWTTNWSPDADRIERNSETGRITILVSVTNTINGQEDTDIEEFEFGYDESTDSVAYWPPAGFCGLPADVGGRGAAVERTVLAALDGGDASTEDRSSNQESETATSANDLPSAPWSSDGVYPLGAVANVAAAWATAPSYGNCYLYAPMSLAPGQRMEDHIATIEAQGSRLGDFQFGFTNGLSTVGVSIWHKDNANPQRFIADSPAPIVYADGSRMYVSGSTFLIHPGGLDCLIDINISAPDSATRSHIISSVRPVATVG